MYVSFFWFAFIRDVYLFCRLCLSLHRSCRIHHHLCYSSGLLQRAGKFKWYSSSLYVFVYIIVVLLLLSHYWITYLLTCSRYYLFCSCFISVGIFFRISKISSTTLWKVPVTWPSFWDIGCFTHLELWLWQSCETPASTPCSLCLCPSLPSSTSWLFASQTLTTWTQCEQGTSQPGFWHDDDF